MLFLLSTSAGGTSTPSWAQFHEDRREDIRTVASAGAFRGRHYLLIALAQSPRERGPHRRSCVLPRAGSAGGAESRRGRRGVHDPAADRGTRRRRAAPCCWPSVWKDHRKGRRARRVVGAADRRGGDRAPVGQAPHGPARSRRSHHRRATRIRALRHRRRDLRDRPDGDHVRGHGQRSAGFAATTFCPRRVDHTGVRSTSMGVEFDDGYRRPYASSSTSTRARTSTRRTRSAPSGGRSSTAAGSTARRGCS